MSAIHKATFDFLNELAANNDRDWFTANKARYEEARANVTAFAADVLAGLARADQMIAADTDPRKCVMRIYRDIRFSKDKSPYKKNFGIGFTAAGRHNGGVGYYVHIQPGECFAGGGYWMPEAEHLKAIRQEIDYNTGDLTEIVDKKGFRNAFGDFREQERLKTLPRDYPADHTHIELLRLKSFSAVHRFSNTEMQRKEASDHAVKYLAMIQPLNAFLLRALPA